MTCKNKGSYESSPPCNMSCCDNLWKYENIYQIWIIRTYQREPWIKDPFLIGSYRVIWVVMTCKSMRIFMSHAPQGLEQILYRIYDTSVAPRDIFSKIWKNIQKNTTCMQRNLSTTKETYSPHKVAHTWQRIRQSRRNHRTSKRNLLTQKRDVSIQKETYSPQKSRTYMMMQTKSQNVQKNSFTQYWWIQTMYQRTLFENSWSNQTYRVQITKTKKQKKSTARLHYFVFLSLFLSLPLSLSFCLSLAHT